MDEYQHTFRIYDKVAQLYQEKFMQLDIYNASYDRFCSSITKPNARIFEIGCGPGNITRYLLQQRPDFRIIGTDMAPNMLRLAAVNNPTAEFRQMDARDLHTLSEKYDGIVCGFCMPYLSLEDCRKLIRDAAHLLETNGMLYFSLIEGDPATSGYEQGSSGDRIWIYYHCADDLLQTLNEAGFEMPELFRIEYPKAETTAIHLIALARKSAIKN